MNVHKRTELTSPDRDETWRLYGTRNWEAVAHLHKKLRVSCFTSYKVIEREQELSLRRLINKRFLQVWHGELGKD